MTEKKRKMDNWTIFFLVLIFIGSIGGVLFSIKQLNSAEDSQKEIIDNLKSNAGELRESNKYLKSELHNLSGDNDSLRKNLKERDEKLSVQNKKIESLNNKIFEKSEFIQNTLFGKGFIYLDIVTEIIPEKSSENVIIYFRAKNNFEFPLYNVDIEIFNFDIMESKITDVTGIKKIDANGYKEFLIFKKVYPEINPSFSISYAGFPLDYLNVKRYYIKITHRNGTYWERVLFHNENKGIYPLIEVFDTKKDELVHSKYEFPKGKKDALLNELNKISVENIKFLQW